MLKDKTGGIGGCASACPLVPSTHPAEQRHDAFVFRFEHAPLAMGDTALDVYMIYAGITFGSGPRFSYDQRMSDDTPLTAASLPASWRHTLSVAAFVPEPTIIRGSSGVMQVTGPR